MARRAGISDTVWSEQDIAFVRRRWNSDGKSAGAIASEMGRTRNSVCGLIHRFRDQFEDRSQLSAKLRRKTAVAEPPRAQKLIAAPTVWTPDHKAEAVRLWAEWSTVREIAVAIGKNEAAVAHFIKKNRALFPHRYKKGGDGRRLVQVRSIPVAVKTGSVKMGRQPAELPALEPAFAGIGIPLTELTSQTCRYPIKGEKAETLFCGHAIWRGSWCRHHAARVFQARAA